MDYDVIITVRSVNGMTEGKCPHWGEKVGTVYEPPYRGICPRAFTALYPRILTMQSGGVHYPGVKYTEIATFPCPEDDGRVLYELRSVRRGEPDLRIAPPDYEPRLDVREKREHQVLVRVIGVQGKCSRGMTVGLETTEPYGKICLSAFWHIYPVYQAMKLGGKPFGKEKLIVDCPDPVNRVRYEVMLLK